MYLKMQSCLTAGCIFSISKRCISKNIRNLRPYMDTDNFYYFDDLAAISPETHIRIKYQTLGRVLFLAIDRRLEGVTVKFAGPLPKIQYLIREYKIRENTKDHSLAIAINATRNRLRNIDSISDSELTDAYPHDLKAVCHFISYIFEEHKIPESLSEQFPLETEENYLKRLKDDSGKAVDSLRCTIERWDNDYIYATRADDGTVTHISYNKTDRFSNGDWSYIRQLLVVGEQLNIIRPRADEDGKTLMPELIIFNPDYLINVTSVAACFEDYGASALWNLIGRIKPSVNSRHTLLGNFAGQLLDDAAYGEKKTYAESMTAFFHDNALAIACCTDIDSSFHTNAKEQQKNINAIMHSQAIHQKNHESLSANDLILEPSFFCETLGLQGRTDFIHLNQLTIIEQKSGKGAYSPNPTILKQQLKHYVQLLLYRAVFHYSYNKASYEDIASYLLYSKYSNGLIELGSAPRLLFEAIKIRNQIAWGELHYAQRGMAALQNINPDTVFPTAKGNKLWDMFQKPQMAELLMPIHLATDLERRYYFRFLRFISTEHVLAKIGNRTKENSGFAALWNSSATEKRQAGNIYERLHILDMNEDGSRITDISFSFCENTDTDIANFRIGDIVVFYPYKSGSEPDATSEIVFRATITDIKQDSLSLRLRNAQHRKVFDFYTKRKSLWAVEHDFMEASFTALYRSIHAFLSANKERRELILGTRMPKTDNSVTLIGNYANGSNNEFNDIVAGAMRAKDVFIIVGPPGTGKTSYGMLNVLKEQLLHTGTSILLMAYTNRAVDEICSKLKDEGIDFLRLGNDFSCAPEFHENLLSKRAERCRKVDEVRTMIAGCRVLCGTTTAINSHTELFQLKKFQLAIIDEASQILEPYIIGLLSAKHGEANAIEKFVLIGDEKQLPAVVQQDEEESAVNEPELNEIKLTNCRLSFFERLLRIYGKDSRHCHMLTRQGRMHPGIADFPNNAFYGGHLQPVPLPHQEEKTPTECPGSNWIENLLTTRRTAFISCEPKNMAEEPDKMNTAEAEIIAEVVYEGWRLISATAGSDGKEGDTFDVNKSIGVIVPYRNQISTVRNAIDRRIEEKGLPHSLHDITIDTVERYQGSQRDLIIYGFTIKKFYQLSFLTDNEYFDEADNTMIDRKLNVAMTRARKHLVMVGNAHLLSSDDTFKRLIDYLKERNCLFEH